MKTVLLSILAVVTGAACALSPPINQPASQQDAISERAAAPEPAVDSVCSIERWLERFGAPETGGNLVPVESLPAMPRLVGRGPLGYPSGPLAAGRTGWVILGIVLNPDGRPARVEPMASSEVAFERVAVSNVQQSRWEAPYEWAFLCQAIRFMTPAVR